MRQGGRHRSHCTYAGGMNEAGPQLFHFLLRPLPLGQVADKAGEDALIAGRLADRKLHRKCRAVPLLAGDHASDADDVFFPRTQVALKIAVMLFAVGRGHQHRSEEHTSELQSLMRISYAVFCLKKKKKTHLKQKTQKSYTISTIK